jgi:hypothetical protein
MEKRELEKHICSTLNIESLTSTMRKQISRFVIKHGFNYDEIARALTFHIEVAERKFEPRYGIAFVEWTIPESNKYFAEQERKRKEQLKSIKKSEQQPNIILKANKIKKRSSIPKIDIDKIGDE